MNYQEKIYNMLTEAMTDENPLYPGRTGEGDRMKYGKLGLRIGRAAMAKPDKRGALKGTPTEKAERVAKFAKKLADKVADKRRYARGAPGGGRIGADFERGVDAATRSEPGQGTTGAQDTFRSTFRKRLMGEG